MLQQPMINKMLAMRLHGMAEALKTQEQDANTRELSFLERLGLLIDQQWTWRENQALARRLKNETAPATPLHSFAAGTAHAVQVPSHPYSVTGA